MELQYDCIPRYGLPCLGGNGCQTGNLSIIADTLLEVVLGRKNIWYSESLRLTSSLKHQVANKALVAIDQFA